MAEQFISEQTAAFGKAGSTAPRAVRTSRQVRDSIVGKSIRGVIARPGREGQPPMVLMLQFDDGTVLEFVSPRSDRLLREAIRTSGAPAGPAPGQLAFSEV